ncbi:MAG TPA: 30S ribosome-binding factor RbfA [Burkholderiales bacterium]|nr:30S ribosome-binding factor RbfA [Burkholderiales bacterium]
MGKDVSRLRRIGEQIRRDLAELIQSELKDPRIGLVTLTDIELSQDYSHAKIYFTLLGNVENIRQTQEALVHASGFLRSHLAKRIDIRQTPQLHFIYDTSVERGIALSRLIDDAVAEDLARNPEGADGDAQDS